jgi:hypothetical protein
MQMDQYETPRPEIRAGRPTLLYFTRDRKVHFQLEPISRLDFGSWVMDCALLVRKEGVPIAIGMCNNRRASGAGGPRKRAQPKMFCPFASLRLAKHFECFAALAENLLNAAG